ncbi:hypothetical protein [Marinobacter sp. MBR-105]
MPRLLAETPDEIGGEQAISSLPPGYQGHCAIVMNANGKVIAVLPNAEEAARVARYAIRPEGGYGSVEIIAAPEQSLTHESFQDWFS